ncbi:MAG: ATP-binding protein [Rhodothermales bacterium]
MSVISRYWVFCLLFLGSQLAWGQVLQNQEEVPSLALEPGAEVGLPFFYEHFSRQDYKQHHQNWAVIQDHRGMIYAANYDGILVYDGASWDMIETVTNTVVRSLAMDSNGVVYVGVQGDFGYLHPDSTGTMQYTSLRDEVDLAAHDIKADDDVWGVHATDDGVYFQMPDRLFRWNGKEMKVWESEHGYHTSFVVRGQLYVREFEVGLVELVDDVFQLVPGGERFADQRVYMMAPYQEDRVLMATRERGLFLFDGASVIPFPTEVDDYLREHRLYHGSAVPGGLFALAMLDGGGVVIIDERGRLIRLLNEPEGVLDDWVNYVYPDAQGGLWMALDNQGLVRVDVPSPLSRYDLQRGLDGTVNDILRHRGHLYVATSKGVYVLEESPLPTGQPNHVRSFFRKVYEETSWALFSADSVLFVGAEEDLFAIRDTGTERVASQQVRSFLEIERADRQIILGSNNGLALLKHAPDGWEVQDLDTPIQEQVRSLEFETDSVLWAATVNGDVERLSLSAEGSFSDVQHSISVRFSEQDGLPKEEMQIYVVNSDVFFSSRSGMYRFDYASFNRDGAGKFIPDTTFGTGLLLSLFVDEEAGKFWLVYPDRVDIATMRDDGIEVQEAAPVLRFPKANQVQIYVEEEGIVWIGNGAELVRYDPRLPKPYDAPYAAALRKITIAGTDRVIYGGVPGDGGGERKLPAVDYAQNNLHFEVGAPTYNDVEATQYQYFLEGKDEEWSEWTGLWSYRSGGLREGRYTLRARARNAQGVVSQEARFSFRVLPPWYRTWWAYALYVGMVLVVGLLYRRYHIIVQENKKAQDQARELARERVINERLQQANKRLQEANEGLVQVNRLKDEFLATTSHELRTPLTAILGFTSILQEELPEDYLEFLDPIESNGQRLLHTVNALLELAKLRAGMLELRRERIHIGDQIDEVIRLLRPLAEQKQIALDLVHPLQPVYVNLDRRFLEQVFYNLVGNAIKFTEKGAVRVTVEQEGEEVAICVEDTGIGIDESFIPHLFDEFKQESTGLARSHEGSGLGLAITARLIAIMEGRIDVKSQKGVGSVFKVTFPVCEPPVHEPSSTASDAAFMR